MRLSCPNCQTEYDVPETLMSGRTRFLRCGRCAHQWPHETGGGGAVEPPPPAAHPPVYEAPEMAPGKAAVVEEPAAAGAGPGPGPKPAAPPPLMPPPLVSPARRWLPPSRPAPPPQRSPLRLLVLFIIVASMIFGLAAHEAIIRVWPASAGFFHALGLAAPPG